MREREIDVVYNVLVKMITNSSENIMVAESLEFLCNNGILLIHGDFSRRYFGIWFNCICIELILGLVLLLS